jgi:uncharacterized protein YndB with AHSA1/START domain
VKIRKRVEINAAPDRVFAFFDDPNNAPLLLPRLVEITSVEPLANGGRRLEYMVRTESGEAAPASSEHVEYEPPHRTVSRGVQAGVEMTATRDFLATPRGTRVVATVEWDVPVRYVGVLVTLPLRGPLRRSMRHTLRVAKSALER